MEQKIFNEYNPLERMQLLTDNCDEIEEGAYVRTLTEDEVLNKKELLSKDFIEFNKIRSEAKQVANEFKEKLKPIAETLQSHSEAIRTRIEEKVGKLFIFKDQETKQAYYYDDKGELVQQRRLRADEIQNQKLPFPKVKTGTDN